ncbi:amino acid permease [Achromobacter sp. NPDC058515]|uniref:amino acid permease n=1 Tax=Achromobacter sp. NPDC058515 TaxID=3346533 RepID=UPI0036504580
MNALGYIQHRESGLPAVLGGRQMSMVAVGTVISYGLISGSAFPLLAAGPAAVLAYLAAALVAVLLMACLSGLASAHPTPGAFGSYAECYLGPAAGFMVRAAYFASFVLIMGTEVSLLAPVLNAWLPQVHTGLLLACVFVGLALVNLHGTRTFAHCEVALSMLKVLALIGLIGLACYYAAFGTPTPPHNPIDAVAAIRGASFPSIWQAFILAALGYVGIESLAVAAGEANVSARALRRRMRATTLAVVGLTVAAVAASAALVNSGVVSLFQAPFGALLGLTATPWPQTLFRALIFVTVLSVLNSQMYCASRMLFSMARAEQAPSALGRSSARGPSRAVIATAGLAFAVFLAGAWFPVQTYLASTSIATTGLLFVWLAIFLTYGSYRRSQTGRANTRRARLRDIAAAGGGALTVGTIAASTWAAESFSLTLRVGLPFMLLLWLTYALLKRRASRRVRPVEPTPIPFHRCAGSRNGARTNAVRLCADQPTG